jgi:hypothetical protein
MFTFFVTVSQSQAGLAFKSAIKSAKGAKRIWLALLEVNFPLRSLLPISAVQF